jgi:uncharacterized protein (DUF934 family)
MPLIDADGTQVADPWIQLDAAAPLPEGKPAVLPLDRWLAERDALAGRNAPLGVSLPNDRPVSEIAADLPRLDAVVLAFPAFKDGRAYSQARLLRERHGFRGQVRATGDVLQDQAIFLVRSGFDAFEVDEATAEAWRAALSRISVVYQPAADGRVPAPWRRHRRQAAE